MTESTIRDLLRSLEHTLSERLRVIDDVLRMKSGSSSTEGVLEQRIVELERRNAQQMNLLAEVTQRLASLEEQLENGSAVPVAVTPESPRGVDLIPKKPLEGIEIIPKKEVVIPAVVAAEPEPLSFADRLLLNKKARKALEAEEMGDSGLQDHADIIEEELDSEGDILPEAEEEGEEQVVHVDKKEAEEEAEEEEEAVAEEEAEEEEEAVEEEAAEEEAVEEEAEEEEAVAEEEAAEEATEEITLEEFEHNGVSYYRDANNNLFVTDDDGELVDEPIGVWNEEKKCIIVEVGGKTLEQFDYKGATYYRDSKNNVFMTDEEDQLIEEPIGVWSDLKKRIIVKKPSDS